MTENITIPNSISVELAEESGWHIGDGSMNYYNNKGYSKGVYQLRGHIEDDREHYINVIKPIFKYERNPHPLGCGNQITNNLQY